ncbi:MAG: hypothetical protein ACUVXA_17065 [Candidatus Jordarchaeum sp.]|uniref:hypothetical protein n=1 Tax=Candidatus Jordarchaeum sp. TaxID=2823881 RepID=UPI00404B0DD2
MEEVGLDKVWLFQWFLQIAGRIQKILGKDYMRIALYHMGNYISGRIGEKRPALDSVDKFRGYGLQRIGQIEDPWNSVLYGLLEADEDYKASLKRGESGFNKMAQLILEASIVGKEPIEIPSIYEAAQKYFDFLKSIKLDVPTSYQEIDADTINVVVSDCLYKDCCRTVQAENLFRDDGTPFCWVLKINCTGIFKLSRNSVEYRLLEFDAPNCRGIIFKL